MARELFNRHVLPAYTVRQWLNVEGKCKSSFRNSDPQFGPIPPTGNGGQYLIAVCPVNWVFDHFLAKCPPNDSNMWSFGIRMAFVRPTRNAASRWYLPVNMSVTKLISVNPNQNWGARWLGYKGYNVLFHELLPSVIVTEIWRLPCRQ